MKCPALVRPGVLRFGGPPFVAPRPQSIEGGLRYSYRQTTLKNKVRWARGGTARLVGRFPAPPILSEAFNVA